MDQDKFMKDVDKTMAVLNLSARNLAAISGISVSAIHSLKKNKSPSKYQTYSKIISALHATIDPKLFSENLRKKREVLNISILSLSKLVGVSYNVLYKIVTNGIIPSVKTCCKITQKLNMPLENLVIWTKSNNVAKKSNKKSI